MPKSFNILLQYCCPQQTLSRLINVLAECRWYWFKNWAIKRLIRKHHVDKSEALIEDLDAYPTFNSFFTRRLKPELRPIASGIGQIACPVDGCVSQMGDINGETIFQAKGFYFSTTSLLGGFADDARLFENGKFATLYLAPRDYHRVHMPITGKLIKSVYIPGQLFSVNQFTTQAVPNLFARNERLVCYFATDAGTMAVILVGAMLVSSIITMWPNTHPKNKITTEYPAEPVVLERGADLGYFEMGSTVIMLFGHDKMSWSSALTAESKVKMGEAIGQLK